MGTTFDSSTPTVWSLVILLTTIIYSSMGERTLTITCDHMKEFKIPLNNEEHYVIRSTEVTLEYNPELKITSTEKKQPVNIAFKESNIHFEGHLYKYPDFVKQLQFDTQMVSVDIQATILGIGTLRTLEMGEQTIDEVKQCRIFPVRTGTDSHEVLSIVNNLTEKIIIHAQLCATRYLCEGSGSIEWKINNHVDKMLTKAVEYMRYNGLEIVTVPDINKTIRLPLNNKNISCEFHAWDGYFRSNQNLTRKKDVFLRKSRNIRIIRANLEINIATMAYQNYKAICGDIVGNGSIKGEIKQLSFEILISIDYSNNSCSIHWKDITVTNIGEMSVTLDGLELPSFKSDISKMLQHKWHNEGIKLVEMSLLNTSNKYVSKHICDKFSPKNNVKRK